MILFLEGACCDCIRSWIISLRIGEIAWLSYGHDRTRLLSSRSEQPVPAVCFALMIHNKWARWTTRPTRRRTTAEMSERMSARRQWGPTIEARALTIESARKKSKPDKPQTCRCPPSSLSHNFNFQLRSIFFIRYCTTFEAPSSSSSCVHIRHW